MTNEQLTIISEAVDEAIAYIYDSMDAICDEDSIKNLSLYFPFLHFSFLMRSVTTIFSVFSCIGGADFAMLRKEVIIRKINGLDAKSLRQTNWGAKVEIRPFPAKMPPFHPKITTIRARNE